MNGIWIGVLAALVTLFVARVARRTVHRRLRRRGGRAFFARRLLRRIDANPEQERVFLEEVEAIGEALRQAREGLLGSRGEFASLVESDALDPTAMDAFGSRQAARLEALRRRAGDALARVHASLDARQRRILAEMIRSRPAHGRC